MSWRWLSVNIADINFAWALAMNLITTYWEKSSRYFLFLSWRTDAREDRSIAFIPMPRRQWRKNRRNFVPRRSCWPDLVAVSGLNLRVCRALLKCPVLGSLFGRVVTSKTKGKLVALDTLPDPRIPNEDLWFYPDTRDRTLCSES